MPEVKHERFLVSLRPQCGLLPAEVQSVLDWAAGLGASYYAAVEDAHLGAQATHTHVLIRFGVARRKSNVKRDIWKKCFPNRVKESLFHGFDVRHVPEPSWKYKLGYLQKEGCEINTYSGISDPELKTSYAFYLSEAKKALKGKTFGCLPMKTSNYMSFIRDERVRSLCPDPLKNFKRLLETDRYTIPFASKKQQLMVERLLANGEPITMELCRHILGDCTQKCDNCGLSTEMDVCECYNNAIKQGISQAADHNPCEHVSCAHMIR